MGSYFVLKKEISVGTIRAFMMLANAVSAIGNLTWQVRDINKTVGIANRIFEIWDVEEENEGGDKNANLIIYR